MLSRRSIVLNDFSLRQLLLIPEDVEILAIESSSDYVSVKVVLGAEGFKHWEESKWGDDHIRGSEAQILNINHFHVRNNDE